METIGNVIGVAIGAVLIVALVGAFIGIPVYFLWNWLMPIIFGLKTITFFQAIGLSVLASLLTKGSSSSKD